MGAPLTLSPAANAALGSAGITKAAVAVKGGLAAKAQAASEDFEAMFLNSMFGQMFAGIDGEGPFGGGSTGVWRSFLSEEYSKSFAKAGGVGIAKEVYGTLLAQQERAAAVQPQIRAVP